LMPLPFDPSVYGKDAILKVVICTNPKLFFYFFRDHFLKR